MKTKRNREAKNPPLANPCEISVNGIHTIAKIVIQSLYCHRLAVLQSLEQKVPTHPLLSIVPHHEHLFTLLKSAAK